MENNKEPFYFGKAAQGFTDVTRWFKDTLGTMRGLFAIVLIVCAIFGLTYIGKRLIDRVLPKKEIPQVGSVTADNGATVKIERIEKQKNSILGLF